MTHYNCNYLYHKAFGIIRTLYYFRKRLPASFEPVALDTRVDLSKEFLGQSLFFILQIQLANALTLKNQLSCN